MSDGKFDVRTIAKLLMVDERRIQQLVKEGWIPRSDRGRYHLVEAVQGYIRYLKEHTRDQQRGTEHARLARAQAMKVEMQNYRALGELQTTAQVDETTQGLVVLMKSGLEAIKGRLSNELSGLEPSQIYQRLETEHRVVLHQCADWLEKRAAALAGMPEPGAPVETSAADDALEVGSDEPGDAGGLT